MKTTLIYAVFSLFSILVFFVHPKNTIEEDMAVPELKEPASTSINIHQHDVIAESRGPKEKVDVCHYDEKTDEYHTITINANALDAHLAHGDV